MWNEKYVIQPALKYSILDEIKESLKYINHVDQRDLVITGLAVITTLYLISMVNLNDVLG